MVEEGQVMNKVAFNSSIRTYPTRNEGSSRSIGDRLIRVGGRGVKRALIG
jgi:hypothetical protein